MILVVDNHDSFTWNLVHYLREAGATVRVERSDALPVEAAMASGADGILISPGPGRPEDGGISLALVKACAEAAMPLLGVCLGHQAIGQAFGGTIVRAPRVMHGKTSPVTHDGDGVFAGLPSPLTVARYHSLVIREDDMPGCLAVTARADDGTVQGVRHRALPIEGVQFHPESIASEHGHALLANFVRHAQAGTSRKDTVTPQKPLA
ncbi:aminodeoxychorismate/anthranilate synthase component II [Sphingosinicella sp. YJ22]|uniref:anthranilate synthase component II n=1 Tax=Sphingosinicella sp. YJ22 TaxID=1104780 RepID=UPI00140C6EEB|nr:aminodeoxychorismate/anthranilate synthase component II [Sphingosinicella sp. YJ22]